MKHNAVAIVVRVAGLLVVASLTRMAWADPPPGDTSEQQPAASTSEVSPDTSTSGQTAPSAASDAAAVNPNSSQTADASQATGSPNQDATTQASSEEPPATEAAPTAEAPAVDTGAAGLISVDFKDADIRQVLRIISLKSGVDIVAGNDVDAVVTIKLTNVPWEEALDIILRTYGFAYERRGRIVRVLTKESQEGEALVTEVFPLNYSKAKEVPDVIKEMLSDRGRVKFDERTNTVIVTDVPTNVFQIKQVISRLDQRTPQVIIQAKIVETKLEDNENLGIDWDNSFTVTQTQSSFPSTFPFPNNRSWGSLGNSFVAPPLGQTAATLSPLTTNPLTSLGSVGVGTLSNGQYGWTLNFLKDRTETKIVSNPSLSVLNNQEANIHIGQEYPIPSYTVDPTTGRTSISGYTPKLTGTVLKVTPHVNPSEEIVIDLKPEVVTVGSDVTYSLGGTSGNISFPKFNIQTAQTQVRIQNGQTIAIGGLVKSAEATQEVKVPILGDIPVVGLLFKNTRWYSGGSDPVRNDLLIFLTVKLAEERPPQGMAGANGASASTAVASAAPSQGGY